MDTTIEVVEASAVVKDILSELKSIPDRIKALEIPTDGSIIDFTVQHSIHETLKVLETHGNLVSVTHEQINGVLVTTDEVIEGLSVAYWDTVSS